MWLPYVWPLILMWAIGAVLIITGLMCALAGVRWLRGPLEFIVVGFILMIYSAAIGLRTDRQLHGTRVDAAQYQ